MIARIYAWFAAGAERREHRVWTSAEWSRWFSARLRQQMTGGEHLSVLQATAREAGWRLDVELGLGDGSVVEDELRAEAEASLRRAR